MDVFLCLLIILIGCAVYSLFQSIKRPSNFPPGPNLIPWLGNTLQLRKAARALGGQHMVYEEWAKRYNSNILGFKLGGEFFVVVLSYKLVNEVQLKDVFEGRPDNFFLRLRTMGTRKGITCTDGKLWHEHRHFAMKQMRHVGYGRTQMEKHIERETQSLVYYIASTNEQSIWPGAFLAPSVINVLWALTAGKTFKRDDVRLTKLLDLLSRRTKIFDLSGGLLAQYPWLRYILPEKTGYKLICQLNEELHAFFMEAINEHKQNFSLELCDSDLIYAYLHELQEQQQKNNKHISAENSTFNEIQLTMAILDFFIAGSTTTSNTMDLILMMLALRTDLQQLLYAEINNNQLNNPKNVGVVVDGDGDDASFPHLSSRKLYPHVDAFIMEVQRYFHITPITGPRRALWDTTLDGYSIPKNTTLLIGLRSVLIDSEHWIDPEIFRPQRFFNENGETFKDPYFMPFGVGRRRCLGDQLARACLFSFTVKILQKFQIHLNDANVDKAIMTLQPGITLSPKPYKVKFIKRSDE